MLFQQFIEKDLGHVSFIFADDISKECVIVDPRRDIDEYIKYIKDNNLNLKYIINTHTHADYIGGHLELIDKYPTAKNMFHKDVPKNFDFIGVKEDDIFVIGNIEFKILETPGHTPYCISAIISEDKIEKYIFTGDILFVGDIARPDLLGEELLEDLLKMSYDTANKLWQLDNELIIFTSHIQGSLCGKELKNQFFSTIGIEKKTNYSFKLSQTFKEEYISNLKFQNIETPSFFKKMAKINIVGPKLLKDIKKPKYLKEKEFFENYKSTSDFIIDFRHPNCFKQAHIIGSINVYEYSNIILIIGSLLDIENRLFLVGDRKTDFDKIFRRLRRIGFDNIEAVLDVDVNEIDNLEKFIKDKEQIDKIINLDISKGYDDINTEISKIKYLKLDKNEKYEIVCKNGYKSIAVASYFTRNNYNIYI